MNKLKRAKFYVCQKNPRYKFSFYDIYLSNVKISPRDKNKNGFHNNTIQNLVHTLIFSARMEGQEELNVPVAWRFRDTLALVLVTLDSSVFPARLDPHSVC